MKKILLLNVMLLIYLALVGQENTIMLNAFGSGTTKDDAKNSAIKATLDITLESFFIYSKDTLNDKTIIEHILSNTSNYIESVNILNADQIPDSSWVVSTTIKLSIDKLASYMETKGFEIKLKGGLFLSDIKQQMINEQTEIKTVTEMTKLLHEILQNAFDYEIKSSAPKSLDSENKNWEIPIKVTAITNNKIDYCAKYCINTLSALNLSSEEVSKYKNSGKEIFEININYKGDKYTFNLRKEKSIEELTYITIQWESYTRLFVIENGIDKSFGNGEVELYNFSEYYEDLTDAEKYVLNTINFLTAGQLAATFTWQDRRTFAQMEQITGYKIKNRGLISTPFKDIDGNEYRTRIVGTNVWMAEDLRVKHFNDGTLIPFVTNYNIWTNLTTGAYTNGKTNTVDGLLYNWYAVNSGKLAPKGWRVPRRSDEVYLNSFPIFYQFKERNWWTCSEADPISDGVNGVVLWRWTKYSSSYRFNKKCDISIASKSFAAYLRCIKE